MAKGKSKRGFASMSPERLREVSSIGGKGAAPENRYFSDKDAASRAGKKARAKRNPKKGN